MFNTPILLITFNRPTHTRRVLEVIMAREPKALYVFQDGAREGNENDKKKCAEVREVVEHLTKGTQVTLHTNYHGSNLVGLSKMIKSKLLEKLKSFDDFDVVFESSDLSRYSIDDVICHTEKSEIVLKENVYQTDIPKISRIFLKLTRMYQEGTIKDVFEDLKSHLKEEKNVLNNLDDNGNFLITCFNSLIFYKEALDFLKQFLKISKLQEFDKIQDLFYFVKSTILVEINLRKSNGQ